MLTGDLSVRSRVALAVWTGVTLKGAAAHVAAWMTFRAMDTSAVDKLASPGLKAFWRIEIQVGILMTQFSDPTTPSLLVWAVNAELQYSLPLTLIFKHLYSVTLCLAMWTHIFLC